MIGFPFMFLGSITDFFFPNFIGKAINAMKTGSQEDVINNILTWIVFMCIGAVSSLIRDSLFGITSERIGLSLRARLFEAIIRKDVSFYDDNRTGDICKSQFCLTKFSIQTSVRHPSGVGWSFPEYFSFHQGFLHNCWHDCNYVYV